MHTLELNQIAEEILKVYTNRKTGKYSSNDALCLSDMSNELKHHVSEIKPV